MKRGREPALVYHELAEGAPFGTKGTPIDGAVRIAFDVHHSGLHIPGLVSQCVNDHTARDGAVWTDAVSLGRARNFQLTCLRESRLHVETESGCDRGA